MRASANFPVRFRIVQASSDEGYVGSALTYRFVDMLESHLDKRSICQLRKTTDGILISVNNTEGNTKLIEKIKQGNKIMGLDPGIKIEAGFPLVVRRWVIKGNDSSKQR